MNEKQLFINKSKSIVWWFGVASWLFGISDRTTAVFLDNYVSAIDLTQLLTAIVFFMCWLVLKPVVLE